MPYTWAMMVLPSFRARSLPWQALLLGLLLLAARPAAAQDEGAATPSEPDYDRARFAMVRLIEIETMLASQVTGVPEIDPRIMDALGEVPRHAFVAPELRPYAYGNHPLPVSAEQNVAAPFLIALMTQLAEPEPGDVVFETGTGAGYHAAVLSRLVSRVYSVEVIDALAMSAAAKLKRLGYDNVESKAGDGYFGWAKQAPFDAIIVKEAVDHLPRPLIDQLKPGGRLVIPLGGASGPQYLTVIKKDAEGRLSKRRVLPVRFSVLQGGERT